MSDDAAKPDNVRTKTRGAIKVFAILASVIPLFGVAVLRSLHHTVLEPWVMAGEILILAPIVLVCVIAMLRPRRKASAGKERKSPPKTLLWYASENQKWRTNLIMLVLIVWFLIGGFLFIASILLASVSPLFLRVIAWLTPTLGLLVLGTVALAMAFLGAALLGPRLIKITTGRMPLGSRRNVTANGDSAV